MKKSALTTTISILLIVASLFALIAAGFGVKDGLAIKQYKEEDEKRKKAVEVRNQGDSLLYSVDRSLGDLGDKVQDAEKETVEAAKKELADVLAGDDIDLIEAKTKALSEALYKITERIYGEAAAAAQQQQQQNGGNATGPDSGEASDFNQQQAQDFYDAEFHNVDDENKDDKQN